MFESISIRSDIAVYVQIENLVQFAIASGKLKAGDRLPPVVKLAEQLGTNFNTVGKAYHELELIGLIRSAARRGSYVNEGAAALCRKQCQQRIADRIREIIAEAKSAGMIKKEIDAVVAKCCASDAGPYEETPASIMALAKVR